MKGIKAQFSALTQNEQAVRKRWLGFELDQRLRPNQLACRPKQRVPALHGSHFDRSLTVEELTN